MRPGQLHGSAVDEALAEAEAKWVQVEPAPVAHQLVLVPEGQTGVGLLQQQLSHRSFPEPNRTCGNVGLLSVRAPCRSNLQQ